MQINVKKYEAKKYYSFSEFNTGYEVIELEKPREVLIDECDYLVLDEIQWKSLKSKLGITKSDDDVAFEDVIGENEGLRDLAARMELGGFLYHVDSDEPCFVDEIMEDAYIIFCSDEKDVIRVYKGEFISSCYFGVCHQPLVNKLWKISDDRGYVEVEYYELDCVEHIRTNYKSVDIYLILEPDNKGERLRVLRGIGGTTENCVWDWDVTSVEIYNKIYARDEK